MYQGLTEKAQDFLWNVRLHNEKPWFDANKAAYLAFVYTPLCALAQAVYQGMEKKYGLNSHLHVSRIYRDMRIKNGKGPYKDHLWFSLRQQDGNWREAPVFYFEMHPEYVAYGLGCLIDSPRGMERFRQAADADPAGLERLILAMEAQPYFQVRGDEYKSKKGQRGEVIDRWYNRKWLCLERSLNWGREAMAKSLPKTMVERFGLLLPAYHYFTRIADMAY